MASPSKKLAVKMTKIADNWVKDPFRPHLQLSIFLKSLATYPGLTREAVGAARGLQNNVLSKKYMLGDKVLHPPSMPRYYDRLVEGFEKSAQGIGRPWWKVFFGIW